MSSPFPSTAGLVDSVFVFACASAMFAFGLFVGYLIWGIWL